MAEVEVEDRERPEYASKLTSMVVDLGTEILIHLFERDIPHGQSVGAYLASNANTINRLKRVFNSHQWTLLNTSQPDLSQFDISLLYILVTNLSSIQPPQGGWTQPIPPLSDTSSGAMLLRLKQVRNTLAHKPRFMVKKSEFDKLWTEASDALVGLAIEISQDEEHAMQKKIAEIQSKPIVDEIYKRYVLEQWAGQDKLEYIRRMIDDQATASSSMEGDLENLKKQQQRTTDTLIELKRMTCSSEERIKVDYTELQRQQREIITKLDALANKIEGANTMSETRHNRGTDYDRMKQDLKTEILRHYEEDGYCTTAIPVLFEDQAVDVNDIFVMPTMVTVVKADISKSKKDKHNTSNLSTEMESGTGSQDKNKITSIHGLFQNDGRPVRKVCIIGDAGQGKTILCQRIVSQWCKVHTDQHDGTMSSEEEQFLKQFEFVFYIPLRNYKTSHVVEMIETQIVREDFHNHLKMVFRKESNACLVILDGLDEWLPSHGNKQKLPYIDHRENFSVIYTSRPWKIEVLRPRMADIGHEIKLCGVMEDTLIEGVVKVLNDQSVKDKNWKDFKYRSPDHKSLNEQYKQVTHLTRIPVLLTQMVCMWFAGKDFGQTRVQMYFKMLEFLLQIAENRSPHTSEQDTLNNTGFLDSLEDLPFCKMYVNILNKLSALAFHTLFSDEKERCLVFPHSQTEIHMLTETDVKCCLRVGILSQSKSLANAASQEKTVSFMHKTLQEFLAALFVAYGGKVACFTQILHSLKTLDNVLEMSEVLKFLISLRPGLICNISHHIAELADKDEMVLLHRSPVKDEFRSCFDIVVDIQDIILDCIIEVEQDRKLDCKAELHDVVCFREKDAIAFKRDVDPFLNTENIQTYTRRDLFPNCLGFWPPLSCSKLVKLDVQIQSQGTLDWVSQVVERCSSSLMSLCVQGHDVSDELDMAEFFSAANKVHKLTNFYFEDMEFSHTDIRAMGSFLILNTQLEIIKLQSIVCKTCHEMFQSCRYSLDFQHHKTLCILRVSGLSPKLTIQLGKKVPLIVYGIIITYHPVSALHPLVYSRTLEDLSVSSDYTCFEEEPIFPYETDSMSSDSFDMTIDSDDIDNDNTVSIWSKTLHALDLAIPTEHAITVGGLQSSVTQNNVKEMDLSLINTFRETSSSLEYASREIQSLLQSRSLQNLDLSHTSFTETDEPSLSLPRLLAIVIPTLKNLKSLILYGIHFEESILMLSPNMTSLENVEISNTSMTVHCFQAFIDSLHKIDCVVNLDISINPEDDIYTALKYIKDRYQDLNVEIDESFIRMPVICMYLRKKSLQIKTKLTD